jgi:hypothetical protein
MITVGMIYNPVPEDRDRWANPQGCQPSWQARYIAQEPSLVELGIPLRRQGGQVGMDQAERWIALSDGGAGLEDFLRSNFGRVDGCGPFLKQFVKQKTDSLRSCAYQ